jgi:hypothetical protein
MVGFINNNFISKESRSPDPHYVIQLINNLSSYSHKIMVGFSLFNVASLDCSTQKGGCFFSRLQDKQIIC